MTVARVMDDSDSESEDMSDIDVIIGFAVDLSVRETLESI
jgi:hypothetical protein